MKQTKKEMFEWLFELDDRLTKMLSQSIPAEKNKNNASKNNENKV